MAAPSSTSAAPPALETDTTATPTPSSGSPRRPIVICGPSGSGKSTLLKRLFDKYPSRFGFSVSHTTRTPRPSETPGVSYHFTTPAAFDALVAQGAFLEHARFGANRYGTSRAAVAAVASAGRTCVLDIEMQGVEQVRASGMPARFLFLKPPSLEVLEKRLRGRATDKEDEIRERLRTAERELRWAEGFDAFERVIVNDDLDRAWAEFEEFCLAEQE